MVSNMAVYTNWGSNFGVLTTRAVQVGVYIRVPDFFKSRLFEQQYFCEPACRTPQHRLVYSVHILPNSCLLLQAT